MNEEQLITELAQYPDQMSSAERMQVYAAGKEVDHIPVSISVREYIAPLMAIALGSIAEILQSKLQYMSMHLTNLAAMG